MKKQVEVKCGWILENLSVGADMAFNINEFKGAIDKQGGLARLNVFEVMFSGGMSPTGDESDRAWITNEFGNRDLKFFCQTVTFPGVSVEVFNHRPNTIDIAQSIPYAIGQQSLECVFMVDDKHQVLNYFHSWMRRISNYSYGGSPAAAPTSTSHRPFELGYKKEYTQSMSIVMYSRSPSSSLSSPGTTRNGGYVCTLHGVYPVQIGSMTLSWNANDEYGTLPVSFSYSSMDITNLAEITTTII